MDNDIYNEVALERRLKERFGITVEIEQIILAHASVSRSAYATVFLTKKKQLLVFIDGHTKLLLSDVKKIVSRMGLKVEAYFPPKNQPDYFTTVARQKFAEVFPGRTHVTDEDLVFYRTLAPYCPALALINEVKDGEIYQFDSDAHGGWRTGAKFAYRRIKTS